MINNNLTLIVLAAGIGSRYGGLKQLDEVGPNGETIIDYSVYDALQAGFTKVIFIIQKDYERRFKLQITDKYSGKFTVEFAFQEINDLPNGFNCPIGREKPWGTGHAILCTNNLISEPFVVINGLIDSRKVESETRVRFVRERSHFIKSSILKKTAPSPAIPSSQV